MRCAEIVEKVVGDEFSRRARQQYLTAMSDRPRPSAPDHRGPEVVPSPRNCVVSVQHHPHTQLSPSEQSVPFP